MGENPREQFVKISINDVNNEEQISIKLINQTGTSNRTSIIQWRTIIICVVLTITGQSIARLLETFQHHHTNRSLHDGLPVLQVVGFPLLILPFFLVSSGKLLITSDQTSFAVLYICSGVLMVVEERLYVKGKLELPFREFLLLYGTQLYFTWIFSSIIVNKLIKLNLWIVISLVFTIVITITTLSSNVSGEWSAILAAVTFSFLLSNVQSLFNNVIADCYKKKASFVEFLELLIFSTLFATVAALFISGEKHDLKREMDGFYKGKIVYVLSLVGQVAAWQIYWVGIVGVVVFVDSIVTANVISLSTYSIVKALKILFCNYEDDEFDGFLCAALALSAFAVVFCFYKHTRGFGNWKTPRLLHFFFLVYYFFLHLPTLKI